jgi:hypothetical protein
MGCANTVSFSRQISVESGRNIPPVVEGIVNVAAPAPVVTTWYVTPPSWLVVFPSTAWPGEEAQKTPEVRASVAVEARTRAVREPAGRFRGRGAPCLVHQRSNQQ